MVIVKKIIHCKDQKYDKLHKQQKELRSLFNDPFFPPSNSSIGNYEDLPDTIVWKRPGELCESPRLFDKDTSGIVVRGLLSTPWVVSAFCILSGVKELCHKVVPRYRDQEWSPSDPDNYVGMFHFRFWRFGSWVEVVIDDLLPTVNDQLVFTQTNTDCEFWVPLAEKAYAKLHGTYSALSGGHLSDGLVDFTGGVSEIIDLEAEDYKSVNGKSSLFRLMQHEIRNHSLMCSIVSAVNESEVGDRTDMGLLKGIAYPLTEVKKVYLGETSLRQLFSREKVYMVRLLDPQGEGRKSVIPLGEKDDKDSPPPPYAYSTSHLTRLLSRNQAWAKVKPAERERLGLHITDKGEFWMPYDDFQMHFKELIICRLLNTNVFALTQSWKEDAVRGHWTVGTQGTSDDRSGGSPDNFQTFLRNPQYCFDITNPEEELIIQMLQFISEDGDLQVDGLQPLLIGFSVIKVEDNRTYRLHKQWDHTPTLIALPSRRKRELFYRGYFNPGRYVIVPFTAKPGEVGGYYVRVFSSGVKLKELKKDKPRGNWLFGIPKWVTVVYIKHAEHLTKPSRYTSLSPYCIVKCERSKTRTRVVSNSSEMVWNSAFIFYRKDPEKPIRIQVYNRRTFWFGKFLGQATLPATLNHEPTQLKVDLMGKGKEKEELAEGSLYVELLTDDDFTAV